MNSADGSGDILILGEAGVDNEEVFCRTDTGPAQPEPH